MSHIQIINVTLSEQFQNPISKQIMQSLALLVFHFSVGLWSCSDSVALFDFIWDFGTVPTVWHYFFDMGHWNSSVSVTFRKMKNQ
jgi:hypothetical protein